MVLDTGSTPVWSIKERLCSWEYSLFLYNCAFHIFSYNHVRIYVKGQAKGAGIMANQKILIADDESRLRKLVRDYLTRRTMM